MPAPSTTSSMASANYSSVQTETLPSQLLNEDKIIQSSASVGGGILGGLAKTQTSIPIGAF